MIISFQRNQMNFLRMLDIYQKTLITNRNLSDRNNLIKRIIEKYKFSPRVNRPLGSWEEIVEGIPQGSLLRLPFFNIYLNVLFNLNYCTESFSFADYTMLHSCDYDPKTISMLP